MESKLDSDHRKRIAFYICMVGYFVCVLYIVLLSRSRSLIWLKRMKPFWSWIDFWHGNMKMGISIALNMVLFVPIGIFNVSLSKSKWIPFFACFLTTLIIESIQYATCLGYFDVDDIVNNFIGGAIGIGIYKLFQSYVENWKSYTILLLAGIIGCVISPANVQAYATQFYFGIENVCVDENSLKIIGKCYIYNRSSLNYEIILSDGEKLYDTNTSIQGDEYVAILNENPRDNYEVLVRFEGYKPISCQTYINHGEISYVKEAPAPDITDPQLVDIVSRSSLKCYQREYEVYIYQANNQMVWLIGKDSDATLIYHVYTAEKEKLPEKRQNYGFDNLSFTPDSDSNLVTSIDDAKYTVYTAVIPREYTVSAVQVGMNKGKEILWSQYFRVDPFQANSKE